MNTYLTQPHTVITLAGPSHSGKTTFAQTLKTKLITQGFTCKVLSSDQYRCDLLGLPKGSDVRTQLAQHVSAQAFDLLFKDLSVYTSFPVNTDFIIVDTTGLDPQFRDQVASIAAKNQYSLQMFLFTIPEAKLLEKCTLPRMIPIIKKQTSRFKQHVLPSLNAKIYKRIYRVSEYVSDFYVTVAASNSEVITDESVGIAVIGDVHECVAELKNLLNKIPEDYIKYLCGDWIDKGNNTEETINFLFDLVQQDSNVRLIMGNHEYYSFKKLSEATKDYKYVLNEETKWFPALDLLSQNEDLKSKFFYLMSKSFDFVHIKTNVCNAYITHAPCPEVYLGKSDSTSLKRQRNQVFKWDSDKSTLQQLDYIYAEGDVRKPLHIMGHVCVGKSSHVWKNKIFIDQDVVNGGFLTACLLKDGKTSFIYEKSTRPETKVFKTFEPFLKEAVEKKVERRIENLSPETERVINAMMRAAPLYLAPTMPPAPSDTSEGVLDIECLDAAVRYFKGSNNPIVLAQPKHMGSRCQAYIHPELKDCFAVSRNGWRIKTDIVSEALQALWIQHKDSIKELLILDCELMPWSSLGLGLIETAFKPYAEAFRHELSQLGGCDIGIDLALKQEQLKSFERQLKIHGAVEISKLEVFGVIYHDGQNFLQANLQETLDKYNIKYDVFNLEVQESVLALKDFYAQTTKDSQMEGIVLKPLIWDTTQIPYMKVRNKEYLRLVYGYDYDTPDRLRNHCHSKNIRGKASTSIKEQNLNLELLNSNGDTDKIRKLYAQFLNEFEREKTIDPRL